MTETLARSDVIRPISVYNRYGDFMFAAWQLGEHIAWSPYRDTADHISDHGGGLQFCERVDAFGVLDAPGAVPLAPCMAVLNQLVKAQAADAADREIKAASVAAARYEDSTAVANEELALRRKLAKLAPGGPLNREANLQATRVGHCPQYDRFVTKMLGWHPRDIGAEYANRRTVWLDNMAKFEEDNQHLSELERLRLLVSIYERGGLLNVAANEWARSNDIDPDVHNGMVAVLGLDWEPMEPITKCYEVRVRVTRTVSYEEYQYVTVHRTARDESDAYDLVDSSDVMAYVDDYSWEQDDYSRDEGSAHVDWDASETEECSDC